MKYTSIVHNSVYFISTHIFSISLSLYLKNFDCETSLAQYLESFFVIKIKFLKEDTFALNDPR